jgi:hypothetical protein
VLPEILEMKYKCEDQSKGHDHTIFVPLSRDMFAD